MINRCGCALIKLVTERIKVNQFVWRSKSTLSRTPTRVYLPARGELSAKQSLAKLPPTSNKNDEARRLEAITEIQQFAEAGEIFRKVMGDIHTLKNKRQIALEGARLVEEGLRFGLKLRILFLLKSLKVIPDCLKEFVEREKNESSSFGNYDDKKEVIRVKLSTLETWSSVKTPPGIIGIFDKPTEAHKCEKNEAELSAERAPIPLTVILDNVREPGNLGSIIRTAAGIGCNVFLSTGCADAWEMKALRGGDGAQFYVPIVSNVNLDALYRYPHLSEHFTNDSKSKGVGIFLADSDHLGTDNFGLRIQPYTEVNYGEFSRTILILGGETAGLSDTVRRAVAHLQKYYPENVKTVSRITIPMCMPIDSLNVANAFGIVGYEIARQYRAKC
ncbi:rRNA methyltransferase 3, mitochondrial [Orchesella cincta]|uniref:rRNA methyltransferase 3, mitochondrial n=1 Tax=Orchesella cincta TaxID=48709 RepID=A0A1D2MCZ5_ORCCI|nr:rRNA methyltransferase 3, mitochondrial [Orchesella cincta]